MKIKVALRNLYISQSIILLFLLFAYLFWFPHSFTKLGGFYKTAWMLIFVDIVLGPLLVLFIYKENKKSLKFDINVLLSIQLIAFFLGAYSLFLKHPAYAVFSQDRFVLKNIGNIYPQPSLPYQFKYYFLSPTNFVIANLPQGIEDRNRLILDVLINGQPDIDSRPEYFSPFEQVAFNIISKGIDIKNIAIDHVAEEKLNHFIKKHNIEINGLAFFPLSGNNKKDVIWAFNKTTAKPIGIIDIDPWKLKVATNLK